MLAEGYTDVIALHQAGFGNAVGVDGHRADRGAGARDQRARVERPALPRRRRGGPAGGGPGRLRAADRLELRVVGMPAGSDPADVVGEEGGAERMRGAARWRGAVRALPDRAQRSSAPRDDEALSEVARHHPADAAGHPARRAGPARLRAASASRPHLVESAVRPRRRAPAAPEGAAPAPPPPPAPARRSTAASSPSAPSSRSASPCRARRGQARRRRPRRLSSPHRSRASPPRASAATSSTRRRSSADDPRARRPRSPSSSSAPASSTPPRPTLELEALQLDLHRLDREITAGRTGERREVGALARERQKVARRDPPPPAVEPKFRPTHELVFVSWTRTGSKPDWPPAARSSRSREELGQAPVDGRLSRKEARPGVDLCDEACRPRRRDARDARRARRTRHVGPPDRRARRSELRGDPVLAREARPEDGAPPLLSPRRGQDAVDPPRVRDPRLDGLRPLGGQGYYRCPACTVRSRRGVPSPREAAIVAEAGGRCLLCGYDALQRRAPVPPSRPDPEALQPRPWRPHPSQSNRCGRGAEVRATVRKLPRGGRGGARGSGPPSRYLRGSSVRGSSIGRAIGC